MRFLQLESLHALAESLQLKGGVGAPHLGTRCVVRHLWKRARAHGVGPYGVPTGSLRGPYGAATGWHTSCMEQDVSVTMR